MLLVIIIIIIIFITIMIDSSKYLKINIKINTHITTMK